MDFRGDFDEGAEKVEEEETEEEEGEEEGEEEEEAEGEPDAEADEEAPSDDDDEEAPKPKPKKKKKAAAPKTTKRRTAKVVRRKAVWKVFDNSSKEIDTFPFNAKAEAEALIESKNTDKKGAYYIQLVKVEFEEGS
jgi:hypothetical protein